MDKPQQIIERSYPVYIDRYRHRPWYNDWQIYCQAKPNPKVRGAFASALSANSKTDTDMQMLASCLKSL